MYVCMYGIYTCVHMCCSVTVWDFLTHHRATNTQQQILLKFTGWRHPQVLHGEAMCETACVKVHTTLHEAVCESGYST